MNDKQLNAMKAANKNEKLYYHYGETVDGKYIEPSEAYKLTETKISCIEMINSILAYQWSGNDAESVLELEECSYHNYLADYTKKLGRAAVIELIKDQIKSISHIKRGVYTDSEGCSYNSIIWKEN